jgi:chromosome segregation ATPase
VFKAELNKQLISAHNECETKLGEKQEEITYLQSNLELLEKKVAELESNGASLQEKFHFMAGEKEAAEARVKGLEERLIKSQEATNVALQENARLEGALAENRTYLDSNL